MQKDKDSYKVIGYNSMCFSKEQRGYPATERELAAIRWGLEVFKPFIYGIPFVLKTDHKPLIYMHNMAAQKARVRRTLEEISEYDFDIKYIPGVKNDAADFLSRMGSVEEESVQGITGLPKDFRVLQKNRRRRQLSF